MSGRVLLSLGSVNADFQVRVKSAPGTGSTLPGSDFVRLGGGKAANRAVLARRLGHSARLFGRVGDDELREQALMPLRGAGVDVSGVFVAPGQATAVSMIAVLPDSKKSIVLAGNANEVWDDAALEAVLAALAVAPPSSLLAADLRYRRRWWRAWWTRHGTAACRWSSIPRRRTGWRGRRSEAWPPPRPTHPRRRR